jgi:hypothetical protein
MDISIFHLTGEEHGVTEDGHVVAQPPGCSEGLELVGRPSVREVRGRETRAQHGTRAQHLRPRI